MLFRTCSVAILVVFSAGCNEEPFVPAPVESAVSVPAPASAFDPISCGAISGTIKWNGSIPSVPPFVYGAATEGGNFSTEMIGNPNEPQVNQGTLAVADVVVYLRGIDPARARPWDLPPATVELKDMSIQVRQGHDSPRKVGFVRRGDEVVMVSAEPVFDILRGRGDAYFSYTFPEPARPIRRRLHQCGRVELSSGAGNYWARASLFVADHPYYTCSDRSGRFTLNRVPPGRYELVAWLPNWSPERIERDPESGLITRLSYAMPFEVVRPVEIQGPDTVLNLKMPENPVVLPQ